MAQVTMPLEHINKGKKGNKNRRSAIQLVNPINQVPITNRLLCKKTLKNTIGREIFIVN